MVKTTNDPGIGFQSKKDAKQVINKDGSSNIIHLNKAFEFNDVYAYLIRISWTKFFGLVFFGYIILNIVFGLIYTVIGIDEITKTTGNLFKDFLNGFFFSAQTVTTVGYGGISPHGLLANIVSTFEALIGLLSFSFITGLLYGRFSKPKASIKFSTNFVIREFNGNKALMFRLMNNKTNVMIEPEINVTLSISEVNSSGDYKRNFYKLSLERNSVMYLPTIWTVVHIIDKESPLYQFSDSELESLDAEIYLLAKYHEDDFAQTVYQMYSYTFNELKMNYKFLPSYSFNDKGYTVLDHSSLSKLVKINS